MTNFFLIKLNLLSVLANVAECLPKYIHRQKGNIFLHFGCRINDITKKNMLFVNILFSRNSTQSYLHLPKGSIKVKTNVGLSMKFTG